MPCLQLNFNLKEFCLFFFCFFWDKIHFHYTNIYGHCPKGNRQIFHTSTHNREGDKFLTYCTDKIS